MAKSLYPKRSTHYNHANGVGQDRIQPGIPIVATISSSEASDVGSGLLSSVRPACTAGRDTAKRRAVEQPKTQPKTKKSKRKKLLIWLAVDLAVAATVIVLLLWRPSRYHPMIPTATDANGQTIHPYLYNDLGSQFYNNAQDRQPFSMIVEDSRLNEAIGLFQWPRETDGVTFSRPEVVFAEDRAVLMGTATVEGAEFVVTIELTPEFDENGWLNLAVKKVNVGVMNITPLAKMIGRRMYLQRLEELPSSLDDDLRMKIAGSLLIDKPFDPVFQAEDKWVRLTQVDISKGKLTAHFVPASRPSLQD